MTISIFDKHDQFHGADPSAALALHKIESMNGSKVETDYRKMQEAVFALQKSLGALESKQFNLQEEWQRLSVQLEKVVSRAESTHKKNVKEQTAIRKERLNLIEEQDQVLKTTISQLIQSKGENLKLHQTIFELQHAISQLQQHQTTMQNEWQNLSTKFHKMASRVESDRKKTLKDYQAINFARLKVIEEQQKALRGYRLSSLKEIIKAFLCPHIGVLHQYEPRRYTLPNRYNKIPTLKGTPTISIVSPSYNQDSFLEKTILSILNQKYPALEYVIQDGASKDRSIQIIEHYQSALKHWASGKDKGQSHALNLGFKHTTGEIMAYLNTDDILLPGTLHYVANYFTEHPDVDVVYGHRIIIDEYDQEIGRWVLPGHDSKVLTWADFIPQETLFWRRRIWDKAGGQINESFKFAMDWDLLLRFKEAGAVFKRLPRFLGAFRVHLHQKTSTQISEVGQKEMERLRIRCHGRRVSPQEIRRHLRIYQMLNVIYHKLYSIGILHY